MLALILVLSCSKDEPRIVLAQLQGSWILEGVSCFCYFPEEYDFTATEIRFENDQGILSVIHRGEEEHFLPAGSYKFNITADSVLQVEGRGYHINFKGERKLQLSYIDDPAIADDEVDYQFGKSGS